MQRITTALSYLSEKDSASYETSEGDNVPFNATFNIDPQMLDEILTKETLTHEEERILQVKKPDYLGVSQWEFRFEGSPLYARIDDPKWLESFQSRQLHVRPGDGLRVKIKIEVAYGHDNEVIAKRYYITKLLSVVPPLSHNQQDWLPHDNDT